MYQFVFVYVYIYFSVHLFIDVLLFIDLFIYHNWQKMEIITSYAEGPPPRTNQSLDVKTTSKLLRALSKCCRSRAVSLEGP